MRATELPIANRARRLLRRWRVPGATAERGFVLPTAIIILFVLTLLTGAAISVATQSSTSTTRDNNVKAELEAAEAGQHVASYRLSQLSPTEAQCINEGEAVEAAKSSCSDSTESLGNEASFRYWTTVPLAAGAKCAGRTVAAALRKFQRCITSEGKVHGVEPAVRLQSLVSAPALLPVNGLFGSERVELSNNAVVYAKGGSNGTFTINNNATIEGVNLGPSGKVTLGNGNSQSGTVTKEASNITLQAVNPGTSATSNSDYRIENGLKTPKVAPYDESSSVTYAAATRSLTVNGSLTLGGSVYNFCNLALGNGATMTVQHKPTVIYIDSPNDPSSKCPAGSGKFSMENNSNIVSSNKEAAALQVYVYDEAGGPVAFRNNVTFYGVIYAPNSAISINNNGEIYGAFAGREVSLRNSTVFHTDKSVEALIGGPFQRADWEQCTRGSGASEGC
jgi:hypothetical protein